MKLKACNIQPLDFASIRRKPLHENIYLVDPYSLIDSWVLVS
jgi:hypothetical protein